MHCIQSYTVSVLSGRRVPRLVCVLAMSLSLASLACGEDWLTVIHTSDIQSHMDESGASAKACSRGAYCYGGMPRLVNLVRQERAQSENVLVLDAGGLFNTALLDNPSAPELLTDLVRLVGYDAMTLGQPELMGGLDAVRRYTSLVGAPFVCTGGLVPPTNDSDASPPCNSSLLVTAGSVKVGIVSYLSPDVPEFQDQPPPEDVASKALDVVSEEAVRLRRRGARLVVALVYTSWRSVSLNMTDITHAFTDVDLVVIGNAGRFFFNGPAPHGEHVSGPYPAAWPRRGRPPLLAVSLSSMLHYAGRLQLNVGPSGGSGDWRAANPILLQGYKDDAAEQVMARLRTSQDALLGGLVARSLYMLEGGSHCYSKECVLGTLVGDAILEASIQPEYKGLDILAWTRAGTAVYHGSVVHSGIAAGLVREEDLRVALPLDERLVIVPVLGSRLVKMLESLVRENMYPGLQVSGLRLGIAPDPDNTAGMRATMMKVLCTVCQMPAFKDINQRYTYRVVSLESTVKEVLSKVDSGLQYERLNITLRDAARKMMRKMSPMAFPREQRIASQSLLGRDAVTGAAPATEPSALPVTVTGLLTVLALGPPV